MNDLNRQTAARTRPSRPGRWRAVLAAAFLPLSLAGCGDFLDDLLSVERPGQVPVAALDDPTLMGALVSGTQADFECAFGDHQNYMMNWTNEWIGGSARAVLVEARSPETSQYDGACNAGSISATGYAALHVARVQGKNAATRLQGYTDADVANRQNLLAKARLYEGYSILLLAEAYCSLTLDAGPLMRRTEGFDAAIVRFDSVLAAAARITVAAQRDSLRYAALVGKARANLQFGQTRAAAVLADAGQVPATFRFMAMFDQTGGRRANGIPGMLTGGESSVGPIFRQLRYFGTPPDTVRDPRVPVEITTRSGAAGPSGTATIWAQRKYVDGNVPVPVGTGREALLMRAEILAGQTAADQQTAVGIINTLRSTVTQAYNVPAGTYNLPVFASANQAEIVAQVREERRRELFYEGAQVMGDLIRWGGPWPTGATERGYVIFEESRCKTLPDYEMLGNPNLAGVVQPVTPFN